MRVYEISEKGGRTSIESSTEKPRKVVMMSAFKIQRVVFISEEVEKLQIITSSSSRYVQPGISRPMLHRIYLSENALKKGYYFPHFSETSP